MLYSSEVAIPKLPPPPRSAQNRSSCSEALAVTSLPSAVTTSSDRILSHVAPNAPISQPLPPPSERPAMPTSESVPPGTAKPNACVAWSMSPQVTPGSARTMPPSGTTRMPFMRDMSTTSPSSHSAVPAQAWPLPRTATGKAWSCAKRTHAMMSDTSAHRAISSGRRSMRPFQMRRASSNRASARPISGPRSALPRLAIAVAGGDVAILPSYPRDLPDRLRGPHRSPRGGHPRGSTHYHVSAQQLLAPRGYPNLDSTS